MLRRIVFCLLPLILSAPALVPGEDFAFARPRPLMALCADLAEKYGLLITYEDAPLDAGSEVDSQIIPRNGLRALTPKWKQITFHVPSNLPTLAERKQPGSPALDPGEALAAVEDLVNQYNASGNPGHFAVTQDGHTSTFSRPPGRSAGGYSRSSPFPIHCCPGNLKLKTAIKYLATCPPLLRKCEDLELRREMFRWAVCLRTTARSRAIH